jgi:methionyl-tRNA formyltransferase
MSHPHFYSPQSNRLNQPGPPFSVNPALSHTLPNENHLLITASFGRILPESLLELFPPSQRLNVHPSVLPAYRGAAPIQHAIMNGDRITGVCIVEMLKKEQGIDAGRIWASQYVVGVLALFRCIIG